MGVGSLGLCLIMGAKLANAEEIIAFDDRKNANKKVKMFGGKKLLK